jgi:hypothetical protein
MEMLAEKMTLELFTHRRQDTGVTFALSTCRLAIVLFLIIVTSIIIIIIWIIEFVIAIRGSSCEIFIGNIPFFTTQHRIIVISIIVIDRSVVCVGLFCTVFLIISNRSTKRPLQRAIQPKYGMPQSDQQ